MLFESECAFFMSSAGAVPAKASAEIATLTSTAITTTATTSDGGGITVTLPEPPEVVAMAALSRAITSTSSNIISVGEVVEMMAQSTTSENGQSVPKNEHSSQSDLEPAGEQAPVAQPSVPSVPQQVPLKEKDPQCLNHDQPEPQQRSMDKRKKRLKPRSVTTGATYQISGRSKTESDVTPKCQPSSAVPPPVPKSKTVPEVTAGRPKVKTITKAALSAIICKQLMASGGQGLGVGIDKELPFTKPPAVRKSAVASGSTGSAAATKKSSTSSVSSSSKATATTTTTTTYSSESSGDPMPDHFAALADES